MTNAPAEGQLKRTLGPWMLWGLGVGYVISGMYFGWNYGLAEGGTLGLAIATFFVIIMYVTFTFSYTELACAIPRAGGAFDYASRALGPRWGFLAGMAQNIEFVFAPPAIAAAIGAYLALFIPVEARAALFEFLQMDIYPQTQLEILILAIAFCAYIIFTLLNIIGVKAAASIELVITVIAVIELLIFAGATLPSFEFSNLQANALPNGIPGIFAAIPFAIWFFLAIEGVANVAEETINPQRNVLIGFGSAIATLVVLCVLTFSSAVGVAGWEAVVYDTAGNPSDSPLPLALSYVVSENNWLYHMLITIGLFGLVASFHGIILAAGRATFEFGRVGFFPKVFGVVDPQHKTPANALAINTVVGIIALLTGKTGDIIIIAVFGALTLYIISMVSLIKLRKTEPHLERPFRVPLYPVFPIIALVIAVVALIALTVYNLNLALIYAGLLALAGVIFMLVGDKDVLNDSKNSNT